jgi:[ribosomal protein S5]-alanine N-acetyltransferase
MGLHRLQAEIDPANVRSRRLVEALGFAYEGTLRGSRHFDGRFFDDAIYARVGG